MKRVLSLINKIVSRVFFNGIEQRLSIIENQNWSVHRHLQQIHISRLKNEILSTQPSSLIKYGFSVYSQNDEDGIIQYIFDQLQIPDPNFIEFGVGATENNTLYLLTKGSKGVWIDGDFGEAKSYVRFPRLKMIERFIVRENILPVVEEALTFLRIHSSQLDFISMDMDGNDFYFIEELLNAKIYPKLFCVEYNAKFRNAFVKIKYKDNHTWVGDDYFGCSLMEYCRLLSDQYTLVACNITGANAFFIRNDYKEKFPSAEPMDIYQPPRYYMSPMVKGHQSSVKYILE